MQIISSIRNRLLKEGGNIMKWKLVLAISLCVALAAVSAFALTTQFGGSYTLSAPSGNSTGIVITPSTNVYLGFQSTSTSYAIQTCHQQGDKAFGMASNTSLLFFKGIGTGNCASASAAAPGGSDSAIFVTNSFSSM